MGIKDDSVRIEDGRKLKDIKESILRSVARLDIDMQSMIDIGNKYDATVIAEVAADIVDIKVEIDKVYKHY